MPSLFYDTPVSFIIRKLTSNRFSRYPEEHAQYDLAKASASWDLISASCVQRTSDKQDAEEAQTQITIVDWYGPSDPENPHNWSFRKKFWVFFVILYVSVGVYMAASIYSAAQEDIAEKFHVSSMVSSLGLGLYVFGYGAGPMFLSPPSELPSVGRNIPYVVAMIIYVIISIPTALAQNIGGLLFLRFLQGFFGSPLLTTGAASLGDVSSEYNKPYAYYSLAMFSLGGPALGITIAGFSVPVLGWRWSLWEIILATGPGVVLLLLLPETSDATILLRRAQRIRKLSGRDEYRAASELESTQTHMISRLYRSLVVPWRLNILDPSIAFTSIYCGLVYAIFYSFFEFFPLVYGSTYNMRLGEIGLVFISIIIAVSIAGIPYALFTHFVVNKSIKAGTPMTPEGRLLPALFASILVPSGLFIFAWTSRPDIHWIVPTIGTMLVSGNVVIIIQCIFVYITMAYPQYIASLFSGNGFVRCSVAFAGVLWSQPLYYNLGVAWGMTLMGCCCVVCVAGIFALYFFGHVLRAKSRFAVVNKQNP
ncbi:MFS general substrate transporter [Aspergillus heterothallicus]